MEVTVEKVTGLEWIRRACEATMRGQKSKVSLDSMYKCEHSPIRTQWFWVEMKGVYTFVSTHFVRHKVGVEHFVMSNRDDRGGSGEENRYTPVNHSMFINAAELIQMSRKRLCGSTHEETRKVMQFIKDGVFLVDPDLSKYMVRECQYRNGICPELKCCGNLYISHSSSNNKPYKDKVSKPCGDLCGITNPDVMSCKCGVKGTVGIDDKGLC